MSSANCDISTTSVTPAGEIIKAGAISKPPEIFIPLKKTSVTNPDPGAVHLYRGQYKMTATVKNYNGDAKQILDQQTSVLQENELKRVQFHKIDVVPNSDGSATITTVFNVMDNQFILGGIIAAVGIIGGFVSGTIFVNKVEQFSETVTGKIFIVGITALASVIAYHFVFKK